MPFFKKKDKKEAAPASNSSTPVDSKKKDRKDSSPSPLSASDSKKKEKEVSSPRPDPKTPEKVSAPKTPEKAPAPSTKGKEPVSARGEPLVEPSPRADGKSVPFFQYTPFDHFSPLRFVDHSVHCFVSFFMSFRYATIAPLQFYFSLFDRRTRSFLTEEALTALTIVDQVKFHADEDKTIDPDRRAIVFKDLMREEVEGGDLFFVVRMVRLGKMRIGSEEADGVRIPIGWGVVSLRTLIGDTEPLEEISAFAYVDESGGAAEDERKHKKRMEDELLRTPVKVYEKPRDAPVIDFIESLTNGRVPATEEAVINFACRLDPIPNEHVHLRLLKRIGKSALVAERLCTFVHTTSSQAFARQHDDLYVTLDSAIFPDSPPATTVSIIMSVRQFSGQPVQCITMGRGGDPVVEATFTVERTPNASPHFSETCIISLAELSNQTLHLFFQIQLSPPPPGQEAGGGPGGGGVNAFLKLSADGRFLEDGRYKLKCFTRAPGTNRMDSVYYLKSAAANTRSNGRDFLSVRTVLGSSRHTQHGDMNALLHWMVYPPNMLGSYLSKLSSGKIEEQEVFRVFSAAMASLLEVFFSEKHSGVQSGVADALYWMVGRCLQPRGQNDVLHIAAMKDLSCLLGYHMLAMDAEVAEEKLELTHKLLSDFLKRAILEADPSLSSTEEADWLKYDQYLGVLLAGWSLEAVVEVINRNNQRRMRQKEKKTVKFTLPTNEEKAGAGEKDEDWSVEQWLDQIGMGKYEENFRKEGYTTLQDVQGLSNAALERMSINVPRHRKIILQESERLC